MENLVKTAEKEAINPWQWQDKMGYAQAVRVHGDQQVLYCAGQCAMNAEGQPVHEGDMRAQIGLALDNLDVVLAQAGFGLADVVRLNYYTTDVDLFFAHYDAVTSRLAQAGAHVSCTLLGITRLAFPPLLVEIEATAVR